MHTCIHLCKCKPTYLHNAYINRLIKSIKTYMTSLQDPYSRALPTEGKRKKQSSAYAHTPLILTHIHTHTLTSHILPKPDSCCWYRNGYHGCCFRFYFSAEK